MSDVIQPKAAPPKDETPILKGRIVTGMPLSMAAKKRITQRFEELTHATVHFTCKQDKTMIAGVRVELNGHCYDETLRGQLLDAQKLLKSRDEEGL